tara:strand:- start:1678 stop:1920 length:243 start_codon:yes stop_codon:yes gene_type:complete
MVLTQYSEQRRVRLVVRGTRSQLEPIAEVLQRLYPGEVTVTSDEDEAQSPPALSPSQIEVLDDLADYSWQIAQRQTAPAC